MAKIPTHVARMLSALQFQNPQREALQRMTDAEWHDLFCRWEISRLLIPLRQTCGEVLPEWVRSRIDQNLADNRERFERIKEAYSDFALASEERGAEHIVVKGFAQWPDFVKDPRLRLQSDIDVYCPPESMSKALDALHGLGYQPGDRASGDHLPPLVPPTPWIWRGNPYDPAIPVSFELHFRFWNERLSRLRPQGFDQFWLRRVWRRFDGMRFPALAAVDNVAYAALNQLQDTLFGAMTLHLVYELARFLDTNANNETFWETWREVHDDSLRRLEAISFRLALHCFACRLSEQVRRQIDRQPTAVDYWFQQFADSPLAASFRPNKDALWLHMSVLESSRDRQAVLLRQLFPTRFPPFGARHIQETAGQDKTSGGAVRKCRRYVAHMARRVVYHLGILPRTAWHGIRWRWLSAELSRDFLTFLAVSFLFNLGMYVFFLLYSLYLLDRGFRENFLGTVTGAVTMGGVVGTLPAGVFVQRLGVRKALLICLALVSFISALRAVFASAVPLVVLAFLGGFALVIWAVSLSPIIAELTTEKNRTLGFTGVFFFGIAVGILGGQLGGRLPGWLIQLSPWLTPLRAKEVALLLASGLVALAILPASRLGLKARPVRERGTYSSSPFLLRFLVAIAVWSVAIGGFSPFFSVYFSRYWQMSLKQIGMVDSISRVSQLLAILTSPALFRKFGLVPGMAYAQLATAITLACLASAPGPSAASALFIGYVAFQWMCEPAIFTVLMNHVEVKDRAGASALTFLVINASQTVAGVVAGASYVRFGYPTVLAGTAIVGLAAAMLFRLLLGKETVLSPQSSQVSSGP